MFIELDAHEARRLLQITERSLSELRVELRRTSTPGFHDALVVERLSLEALADKLRRIVTDDA